MLKVNSSTIDGLSTPEKHKRFVRMLADNVAKDSRVSKAFIFGSCAKGATTELGCLPDKRRGRISMVFIY